jgi:chromosome segregation ATPase
MCKKFLIAGVAVIVGLLVVKKTEVGSHLRAWWKDGRNFVKNSISIDKEIERVRGDIGRLDHVYKTQFHPVAAEAVAVENLKQEIAKIEKRLEEQQSDIEIMKNDLKSGTAFITYGDVKYTREKVQADLARRFEAYKTCETGLKAKRELLEAKEEKLAQAMKKLEEMKNARTEMEAELARLEAEYEGVKTARARSNFQIDDSELSRIKSAMAELKTRVQVEKKKCELAGQFLSSPINPKVEKAVEKRDLVKEIEEHFSKNDVKVEVNIHPDR